MKVVASNNTIRLLSIFFFILLFSGISLLYKDVISNGIKYGRWFTLDRYEEMLEDCDHIKMGGVIKVSCNALIYPSTPLDNKIENHCFNILILSSKEKDKQPELMNFCIEEKNILWHEIDKWKEEKDKLTPTIYSFVYSTKDYGHYYYNNIEIRNATEEEYYNSFVQTDKPPRWNNSNVKTNYLNIEDFQNYITVDKYALTIEETGKIIILETILTDKEIKEGLIHMTFTSRIKDKEVKFTAKTRGFHFKKEDKEDGTVITTENMEDIKIGGKYELSLGYLTKDFKHSSEEIDSICKIEKPPLMLEIFCMNKDDFIGENQPLTDGVDLINKLTEETNEVIDLENTLIISLKEFESPLTKRLDIISYINSN